MNCNCCGYEGTINRPSSSSRHQSSGLHRDSSLNVGLLRYHHRHLLSRGLRETFTSLHSRCGNGSFHVKSEGTSSGLARSHRGRMHGRHRIPRGRRVSWTSHVVAHHLQHLSIQVAHAWDGFIIQSPFFTPSQSHAWLVELRVE